MSEFIINDGELIQYNGLDSEVIIPDNVVRIKNQVFYRCKFLTKIVIPDSVTEIGEYVFADCYQLEFVQFPEKLVSIGKYAFANTRLSHIKLPESVTKIEEVHFMVVEIWMKKI